MRNDGIRKRQGGGGWMIGRRDSLAGLALRTQKEGDGRQAPCFSSSASHSPSFGFNPWTRLHFQPIKFCLARSVVTKIENFSTAPPVRHI
ncbi:Uncharacterized protein HZ326_14103 [Fusarium oxysporum f. sp. albedinis]|nr:Uncharacterized protein HZ326_14103 [Fusarium oxysporum f. sp. albedinis]